MDRDSYDPLSRTALDWPPRPGDEDPEGQWVWGRAKDIEHHLAWSLCRNEVMTTLTEADSELRWHKRFLAQAFLIATWSKDPSTQTGCVLVRDRRIIATGYNGFPRGMDDSPERYQDREFKLRHIVHADLNALFQCAAEGIEAADSTMYLTGPPCHDCGKGIVQAGVREVVWPVPNKFEHDPETQERWRESVQASEAFLNECGVTTVRVPFLPQSPGLGYEVPSAE